MFLKASSGSARISEKAPQKRKCSPKTEAAPEGAADLLES
jgi:hypothetical protein